VSSDLSLIAAGGKAAVEDAKVSPNITLFVLFSYLSFLR
jgi:hypothetical protein